MPVDLVTSGRGGKHLWPSKKEAIITVSHSLHLEIARNSSEYGMPAPLEGSIRAASVATAAGKSVALPVSGRPRLVLSGVHQ